MVLNKIMERENKMATQKMSDQEWSDIYVVFTMSLSTKKLKVTLIALLFQVLLVLNQIQRLSETI